MSDVRLETMANGLIRLLGAAQQADRREREEESRAYAAWQQYVMATAAPSGKLGDGRLATIEDASAAGLLDASGLFLGALDGRALFFAGDGQLLSYARAGSGKGRDWILPNLAHVRDRSLLVVDVKDGENCFASHHHRSETLGQRCIYLNPFGLLGLPDTPINPLQTLVDIVKGGFEIDTQADEIAQILLPPAPKAGGNEWVRKGALRLLATRMEYLAHCEPSSCNLGGLWRFVNAPPEDTELAFSMMETCGIEGIARRAGALRATFMDAPKQFEAYKSDAIEALAPFEPGKTLERATREHGFDFARLKHEPCTVYLITPSEKLGVIAPWISLIVNYAIEAIAREPGPIRTCFVLDEFPQLPPAPAILKALRLYRGRGIQLWIFSQGRFSMESRWSREAVKEFEDQAMAFTMTGVEDPDLLRDVEKWSGNRTIVTHGQNVGGGAVESAGNNRGETRRAVLQSEDIRAVGAGRQIIKVAGIPSLFVCDRLPFYAVDPWKDQIGDVRDLHKGEAN
ncbi:type IV secretory system conjugative DNA transfer family protein [Sphingobium sp. AS12]|uniref:type IV secretory system conjugative DNA transfer family protein n=1 Tax=Sphingobium sp. AS12 TaxID=2849495 RepID=UPI001C31C25F|nr:type IV secretory system conjugative DNA transfer family protein [Sphingobium sp. AS12]MBV2147685.1 type IV secretory system conjugative DNA transfer family protein [Sphingobium sp. AS12]